MPERVLERYRGLYTRFDRKGGTAPTATHYCAGCGHGVLHKLIGEALADFGLQDRTVLISPVGCTVFAYYYFDCGNVQAAHGRAPAVGTAIARVAPDSVVISYQGDGDLASIGLNETVHAANRGERLAVFFVNNAVYGMTGGQMAPTSLIGQRTVTSPSGRDPLLTGYPLHVCELLNQLPAPVYIERCSLGDASRIVKARRAVRKALEIQRDRKGFAFVEFLSPCPTNTHGNTEAAARFVTEDMEKEFPLGCLRDRTAEATPLPAAVPVFDKGALDHVFLDDAVVTSGPQVDRAFVETRVRVAGFGGQGVLSLGAMVAFASQKGRRFVTWFPSYGPEQRGGTASCEVVLSGQPVGSPCNSQADVLIALNRPSLERFGAALSPGGLVLYEASAGTYQPRADVTAIAVPALDLASQAGIPKAANVAMLGTLAASGRLELPVATFRDALAETFAARPQLIAPNGAVFDAAAAWAGEHASASRS